MDTHCTVTSPEGLQDWFTDLDGWTCRFNANVTVSRSQPNLDHTTVDKCQNCSPPVTTKDDHVTTQPSVTTKLHDFIVNGILVQNRNTLRNKEDFLSILKHNVDVVHYDYVLLTTVIENGRKHFIQKYIRSKI